MEHSSIAVTMNHYIGNMNNEEIFDLYDALLYKTGLGLVLGFK
jgi:hypothetical protein